MVRCFICIASFFFLVQFVVSQVNPHVVPFAQSTSDANLARDGVLARVEMQVRVSVDMVVSCVEAFRDCDIHLERDVYFPRVSLSARQLHLDLRHQFQKLAKLRLIPQIFAGVLTQKYDGDVTILPDMSLIDSLKAISHPSRSDMQKYIEFGQRATWRHVARLRSMQAIEAAIDSTYKRLLLSVAPSAALSLSLVDSAPPSFESPPLPPPAAHSKAGVMRVHSLPAAASRALSTTTTLAVGGAELESAAQVCRCIFGLVCDGCLDRVGSFEELVELRAAVRSRRAAQQAVAGAEQR